MTHTAALETWDQKIEEQQQTYLAGFVAGCGHKLKKHMQKITLHFLFLQTTVISLAQYWLDKEHILSISTWGVKLWTITGSLLALAMVCWLQYGAQLGTIDGTAVADFDDNDAKSG